ncbi:hypothetical protein NQ318_003464 [Aromia moschata]|uniref:Nuclear protein MDM1 n=1 Tax=Aromia moschata TaxID=1265417 RepID=A0AAV8YWK5_9CUCU|nr:hypothetical protein NQ318_003464 [Aromia moschata]
MIGSFWNLCPALRVSEYVSMARVYRTKTGSGEKTSQANAVEKSNDVQPTARNNEEDFQTDSLAKLEPAMPRRKKYPDLAYRHHEFLINDGGEVSTSADRARSGMGRSGGRRDVAKSEGPARCGGIAGDGERERERRRESDPDVDNLGRDGGLIRKAISKIGTEYRLQFAWPQGHTSRRDAVDSTPRKSQSMGALKAKAQANAMVHKKRIDMENKDASELEPLVDDKGHQDKAKEEFNSEYKKNFRPFSQYEYTDGRFSSKEVPNDIMADVQNSKFPADIYKDSSWYQEVVELRKKAGEYKHRGWGSELAPDRLSDIYNKQVELWDQVSRRSSLSALSLASMTHKSYTKEEKEDDNNRKSSPTKAYRNAENSARMIRDIMRHHLERTTGGSEFDGLILSPTREKLEPTIPRKDDDSRGSQKNSPKKSSPMKSSSLKRANQKTKQVRSQSVGPTAEGNVEKDHPNVNLDPRPQRKEESRRRKFHLTKDHDLQPKNEQPTTETKDTSTAEEHDSLNYEPVVKSPPEPTRVKSPEQILMRSPDPVNWTVPLDTGKTFTVTQNAILAAGPIAKSKPGLLQISPACGPVSATDINRTV